MNPPTPPQRILLVRLSALGDVLQTLPVLTALRTTYPEAKIGWLVEADAAPILENHPHLDFLHISHRKRWMRLLKKPQLWGTIVSEVNALLKEIKNTRYDVGLDFQGLMKSALTLYSTGIKHRIGFEEAREGSHILYTQQVPLDDDFFNPKIPILKHFLTLASTLGKSVPDDRKVLLPPAKADAIEEANQLFETLPKNKPVLVLAPATMWRSKHWPWRNWTWLIEKLLENTEATLVLVGTSSDIKLSDKILAPLSASENPENRLFNWVGQTSFAALRVVLEKADGVIGPDSAPIHLAGAAGNAFIVGIYGPTAYRRSGPPGTGSRIFLSSEDELSCQPCDAKVCPLGTTECMKLITPEQVLDAVMQQLAISVAQR